MARPRNHPGEAYTISVIVKLNPEGVALLDRLRGSEGRSPFMRGLLRAEAQRQRAGNEMGRP